MEGSAVFERYLFPGTISPNHAHTATRDKNDSAFTVQTKSFISNSSPPVGPQSWGSNYSCRATRFIRRRSRLTVSVDGPVRCLPILQDSVAAPKAFEIGLTRATLTERRYTLQSHGLSRSTEPDDLSKLTLQHLTGCIVIIVTPDDHFEHLRASLAPAAQRRTHTAARCPILFLRGGDIFIG